MATLQTVRDSLIGRDGVLNTPYGRRPLVYADYGASGRASSLIDERLAAHAALYANPHNEDSATGHAATAALHAAVARIKRALGADERHALIACGSGATAGVHRLQEILGVAIPPATRAFFDAVLGEALDEAARAAVLDRIAAQRPVVFIGPYEHHSNELSWRESLAEVVPVDLTQEGQIDFDDLIVKLSDPRYSGRKKIGAFSAASNVTGVKTDVAQLARTLHAHGAVLALDGAASAPYLPIDVSGGGDPDARVDAVYFSPHKMIGGPGSCGLLLIDKTLYRADLAPSCCGGGTVRYVTPDDHDFIEDVEARERAGTPGLPQLMRAAEALDLLGELGWAQIEAEEHAHLAVALKTWAQTIGVELYGPRDPKARIGLVSFNLRTRAGELLHPKFVARLLNDLFGIQARAGCSCAGPYGHRLLNIGGEATAAYRDAVSEGFAGLRPGWVRVSLHWSMTGEERDYLIEAVRFLARHGERFLAAYRFDPAGGAWTRREGGDDSALIAKAGGAVLRSYGLAAAERILDSLEQAEEPAAILPARFAGLPPVAGLTFEVPALSAAE